MQYAGWPLVGVRRFAASWGIGDIAVLGSTGAVSIDGSMGSAGTAPADARCRLRHGDHPGKLSVARAWGEQYADDGRARRGNGILSRYPHEGDPSWTTDPVYR